MKEKGIGGFFMHARGGLETPYMENEWIRDYIPRPTGIGEEDTLEVIKELVDKYESVINEF